MQQAKTAPEYYKSQLLAESSDLRASVEQRLEAHYRELPEARGVPRLKLLKVIDRLEQRLAWQGANPKEIPFDDLKEHIQYPSTDDPIENKYKARIKNRATAIRAYCVSCMGGDTVAVRECASMTCPLHGFRMGTDPLRGFDLPKAAPVEIPDDDEADDIFEEGDDGDESDATE